MRYVRIYYSINEGNSWNFVEMNELIGKLGTWEGAIPSQLRGTDVLWYVKALDSYGWSSTKNDSSNIPFTYTIINQDPIGTFLSPNAMSEHEVSVKIEWDCSDLESDPITANVFINLDNTGWQLKRIKSIHQIFLFLFTSYSSSNII